MYLYITMILHMMCILYICIRIKLLNSVRLLHNIEKRKLSIRCDDELMRMIFAILIILKKHILKTSDRKRHPRIREPRRGVLERPTPATFSFLPARASYPRNPRELFRPSFTSSVLIVPPRRKRPRKRGPHSHESTSGTHRDTQGKAPRSTPPTIGLLSCYFLPVRRTTPASSRRWS